jgi:hypothetical protein
MTIPSTRTITITAKVTHTPVNTQYWLLDDDDTAYLTQWMILYQSQMSEIATHDEELRREYFKRRPAKLPKGQLGPNSYASFIGGLIAAKVNDPKKNFSTPQLDGLETMFDVIAELYSETDNPPSKVRFVKSLIKTAAVTTERSALAQAILAKRTKPTVLASNKTTTSVTPDVK